VRIDGDDGPVRRRWIFRFVSRDRTRERGLGGRPEVSLAEARKARDAAEKFVQAGQDPITAREGSPRAQIGKPSSGQMADALIGAKGPEWRNEKRRALWKMTLEKYAARLWSRPVDEIDTEVVSASAAAKSTGSSWSVGAASRGTCGPCIIGCGAEPCRCRRRGSPGRDLTTVGLARPPAILARDTHGMDVVLDEARVVDDLQANAKHSSATPRPALARRSPAGQARASAQNRRQNVDPGRGLRRESACNASLPPLSCALRSCAGQSAWPRIWPTRGGRFFALVHGAEISDGMGDWH